MSEHGGIVGVTDYFRMLEIENLFRANPLAMIALLSRSKSLGADAGWSTRIAGAGEWPSVQRQPANPPRPRPVAAAPEVVEVKLRTDPPERRRVVLTKTARAEIIESCSHWDRRETGGYLIGTLGPNKPFYISIAGECASDHQRNSVALESGVFSDVAEHVAQTCGEHLRYCGCWHTHPAGGNVPSDVDLAVQARLLARSGLGSYVSLIVAPNRRWRDWRDPVVTAWTTRRDRHHVICERADIS